MKGFTPDDLTDSQKTDLAFKAALIGGGACLLAGGNFLKGALVGCNIAMFNYLEGEDLVEYLDEEGHKVRELHEVNVIAKIPKKILDFKDYVSYRINSTSYINTGIDCFGQSLAKYGANSTVGIGKNIEVYWKTPTQRPFYGNQYISTQKITSVGSKIVGKTGTLGKALGGAQVIIGVGQDVADFSYYGHTYGYNTVHAAVSFGGALGGMKAGIYIGGGIGSCFGGVGAIPGSIIGATIFGILGAYYGGEVGGQTVDWLYGK